MSAALWERAAAVINLSLPNRVLFDLFFSLSFKRVCTQGKELYNRAAPQRL
jgi:hypothetical protein